MRISLLASGLCVAAFVAAAENPETRVLFSFEKAADLRAAKTAGAKIERVREGKGYALRVAFDAAAQPAIEFTPGARSWDWTPFGGIGFDATNPGAEPLAFSVEVTDAAGAKSVGRTALPLRAGESASFVLALNAPPPVEMGMRGEPAIPGFRLLAEDHKPVDLSRIASIRIFLNKPAQARTLVLDNVRLAPRLSYEKIVDAYGQFAKADWPGKLKSDADFASRTAEEAAELKVRPSLPDRDEYGGWTAGPTLAATGYFRSEKREGKWWLVTPGGRLFLSLGLDCVTAREGGTVVEGREEMFQSLPPEGDPLAAYYNPGRSRAPVGLSIKKISGRTYNFYEANLHRKYGANWERSFRTNALARLRAWGFNTIANWSDPAFYESRRMPYTVTLGIRYEGPEISSGNDYWRRMYDVFDPRFAEAVERSLASARQRRGDPWVLGYFVDNELPWGNMRDDRSRYGLALGALSQGANSAAKRAFVEQLQTRYPGIEKVSAAWGVRLNSWEDLLEKPFKPEGEFSPAMKEDLRLYMKEFAGRYFRTIRDALRKHDPNHMYLGVRFAWVTREEVEACAEYCDVISFNIYRPKVDPAQWTILDGIDKPAIIGEFHMGALDRGMFHTGLVATPDQAARAEMYKDYIRSVVDHPLFVGCHFFKYNDEPLTGRPGDGENYNIGFTTVTDSVYPEMVSAAKEVHAEVYTRRAGKR